jgi:hypothetical protein
MSMVGVQCNREPIARLLDLARRRCCRRVVCDRRDGDERRRATKVGIDRRGHLRGADDVDACDPAGVASDVGPLTSVTIAPASAAACASAKPILPELVLVIPRTGSIASNVGPAVNSTRLPARILWLPRRVHCGENFVGFQHPTFTRLAAGLITDSRTEDGDSVSSESRDIALVRSIRPHQAIHRRGDEQRAFASKGERGQKIVGEAVGDLGEEIRRRRRNDDAVRSTRQIDMSHAVARSRPPQVGQHGAPR